MSRIGLAVVRLGPAALPHAKSLLDLQDRAEVRWAASRSRERAAAFARSFPFPATTDMETAIADSAVDAVLVLTPPAAHLEVAERCFAGKHVLVEKPLELTVARRRAFGRGWVPVRSAARRDAAAQVQAGQLSPARAHRAE